MKTIRRYFQTGDLPVSGTVCDVDELPFHVGKGASEDDLSSLSAEDRTLKAATRTLSEDFVINPFGLM